MIHKEHSFALCVRNDDSDDLIKQKLYQIIPDKKAASEGFIRIIDESGEDYLYPSAYFYLIKLPRKAQLVLAEAK